MSSPPRQLPDQREASPFPCPFPTLSPLLHPSTLKSPVRVGSCAHPVYPGADEALGLAQIWSCAHLCGKEVQSLLPDAGQTGVLGRCKLHRSIVLPTSLYVLALTRSIKTQLKTTRLSLLRVIFGSQWLEGVCMKYIKLCNSFDLL